MSYRYKTENRKDILMQGFETCLKSIRNINQFRSVITVVPGSKFALGRVGIFRLRGEGSERYLLFRLLF